MSTNKCPPNDDSCVAAGFPGGFPSEEPPCDHYGGAPCFYFHKGPGSPRDESIDPEEHCTMPTFYNDVNGNRPCGNQVPGWYREQLVTGHLMRWADSAYTFLRVEEGSDATFLYENSVFYSKHPAIYQIHFDPNTVLEVDACCNEEHCGTGEIWIGRVRWLGGGLDWDIWCNIGARVTMTDDWAGPTPPDEDPRWCRQSIFRALRENNASINLGPSKGGTSFSGAKQLVYTTKGMVSILAAQQRGTCFPYENWYCFVKDCGDSTPTDDRKFACVENGPREDSVIGSATATLDVVYSMGLSIDFVKYPHPNPWERHMQRTLLEFFALKSSGEVSHAVLPVTEPDTKVPYTWQEDELWDEEHPDGVEYPIVEYAGGVYPGKPDGEEIQVKGKSLLTGIEYPMEFRLISASTTLELLVEKKYATTNPVGTHRRRLFANAIVKVICQVWLKEEAYTIEGPFQFLSDISEPWDHRFADPSNPDQPYALDRLVISGPNGEKVHPVVTWLGRICVAPIGLGTSWIHPCANWVNAYPVNAADLECCSALQMLDGAVIPGQLTDMSDQNASHLFTGNLALTVPNLNTEGNELYADCGCLD